MYDLDKFAEVKTDRFTTKERIFLSELFNDISPTLFKDLRSIVGIDPIEEFLNIISEEWWNDQHS